ncbi:MAG: hypothetical protein ACOYNN_13825 [Terrimicrobiaceae bacterium]
MGFPDSECEYLICDNREKNAFSAFEAVRSFLVNAKGKYVIIIHQDAFPQEPYEKLLSRIRQVETHDARWGVIGNAGKSRQAPMEGFLSLETHAGLYRLTAPFVQVDTIDENVMVIRNGAGITVSADLEGYHFYAFDICSVAARLGFTVYVIEFQWKHLSPGTIDKSFLKARKALERKMSLYHVDSSAMTTCTSLYWGKVLRNELASACRAVRMLDGNKVHSEGFEFIYAECRQRWWYFHHVYFWYSLVYHDPKGHFARSTPMRIWHFCYGSYRVARKRLGWEWAWWSKNWRSRLGL